jgi:uncharacterized protein YehS (DUF1456 family)
LSDKSQTKLQNLKMTGERLSREKEKQLKQSGQMVVKRKFGWMYAPDNLEKWLEKMEELGFNLCWAIFVLIYLLSLFVIKSRSKETKLKELVWRPL